MKQVKRVTVILFAVAALLYFFIGRYQPALVCSVFKILPSLILFFTLLIAGRKNGSSGTITVLCMSALLFSMLGDVAGEWKEGPGGVDAFLLQIISFAVAQVLYTASFVKCFRKEPSVHRNAVRVILCLILAAYMICFGLYILSYVDAVPLKIAVSVYVLLIGTMGLSSVIQCRKGYWCFIAGALLFICSDSILAYNAFVGHVPQSGLLIMTTYYAAQLLLNMPVVLTNPDNGISA